MSFVLQRILSDGDRKRLEYEFHSACYHTDMEVVAGLRTSIGHLIKEVGVVKGVWPHGHLIKEVGVVM